MTAAQALRFPLRTATYQALIGLLAVTGMRVGEAIRLDRGDIDLADGVLTVRERQVRQVPPGPGAPHHRRGAAATTCGRATGSAPTRATPARVHLAGRDQAALLQRPRHVQAARGARRAAPGRATAGHGIHDLRHTFAVRTLLDAYRIGVDGRPCCRCCRPISVTPTPKATYWYLPAVTGAAGARRAAAGAPWLEAADERARPDPAGVLHRPARPGSGTPARRRSPPTATPGGCSWRSPPAAPASSPASSTSPTWTPR